MALSAENTARLQAIRGKVLAGTDTLEDVQEGIRILRADRVTAQSVSSTSRTKKAEAAAVVDPASVLAGLRALGTKLSSGPVA